MVTVHPPTSKEQEVRMENYHFIGVALRERCKVVGVKVHLAASGNKRQHQETSSNIKKQAPTLTILAVAMKHCSELHKTHQQVSTNFTKTCDSCTTTG